MVTGKLQITNQGPAPVTGIRLDTYMSFDDVLDTPGDRLLQTSDIAKALADDESSAIKVSATPPASEGWLYFRVTPLPLSLVNGDYANNTTLKRFAITQP